MDRLAELAPGITPYRFAFNNPNYWSDPTGLFENRNAALAYIERYDIIGANIINAGTHWVIQSGDYSIYQSGNSILANYLTEDGFGSLKIDTAGGGGSGFGENNAAVGIGNGGANSSNVNNTISQLTVMGLFTGGGQALAQVKANDIYNYGTRTMSAEQITAQNRATMTKVSNVMRYGGYGFGALNAGSIHSQYGGNWSNPQHIGEQVSNFISTAGGKFAIPWTIGWESGRAVTNTSWYQEWKQETWLPYRQNTFGY